MKRKIPLRTFATKAERQAAFAAAVDREIQNSPYPVDPTTWSKKFQKKLEEMRDKVQHIFIHGYRPRAEAVLFYKLDGTPKWFSLKDHLTGGFEQLPGTLGALSEYAINPMYKLYRKRQDMIVKQECRTSPFFEESFPTTWVERWLWFRQFHPHEEGYEPPQTRAEYYLERYNEMADRSLEEMSSMLRLIRVLTTIPSLDSNVLSWWVAAIQRIDMHMTCEDGLELIESACVIHRVPEDIRV